MTATGQPLIRLSGNARRLCTDRESLNCPMSAGLAVSGCLSVDGDAWLWGFGTNSQLGKGDDDGDELLPRRLAETKRFQARAVVQLEFGGQHALLLTVPRQAPAGEPKQAPDAAPAQAQSNGASAAGAGAGTVAPVANGASDPGPAAPAGPAAAGGEAGLVAVANGASNPVLAAPAGPAAAGGSTGPAAADAANAAADGGAGGAADALEVDQAAGGAAMDNGQAA